MTSVLSSSVFIWCKGGKESFFLYLWSFYIFFPDPQMLWALIFLEKPQPVGDWGHVMSLDLSPWLWYQFFRAPNSQSGWIKESAINGHSFEMPLLLLWKKKGRDSDSPWALTLLLPALLSHGNHKDRILPRTGASLLWGCCLPCFSQKSIWQESGGRRCLLSS